MKMIQTKTNQRHKSMLSPRATIERPAARISGKTPAGMAALLLAFTMGLQAQTKPTGEVVADLLEAFSSAKVEDSPACEVSSSTAGGVKQDALFEHPLRPGRPARVTYALELPPGEDQVLLFAFDTAIADGAKFEQGADGVLFTVEVNGQSLFSAARRESRWQSHAVDLTALAGRRVSLVLVTDGLHNTSYDWAVWGMPRVLRWRGCAMQPSAPGKVTTTLSAGALALRHERGTPLTVRLQSIDSEKPLQWTVPAETEWFVKDFSFTNTPSLQLSWEPASAVPASNILMGAYAAKLRITQLAPVRAVITAGQSVPIKVQVENQGRGSLAQGEAQVQLLGSDLTALSLSKLDPRETWQGRWDLKVPPLAGLVSITAELRQSGNNSHLTNSFEVFASPRRQSSYLIQNEFMQLEFVEEPDGYGYAHVLARQPAGWAPVATWRPLFHISHVTRAGESDWVVHPRRPSQTQEEKDSGGQSIQFDEKRRDSDGVLWAWTCRVSLEPGRPVARLHYTWKAEQDRQVRALWGPHLYVGDGASGAAKTWGLFPGLEYLYGPEPSSNRRDFTPSLADRRTPHPHKITAPLMAITVGPHSASPPENPGRFFAPDSLKDRGLVSAANSTKAVSNLTSDVTIGLYWDPQQKWDGDHSGPSARFASPNFDQGMENHRLGLFLPSTPEFVAENTDRAATPYALPAGKTVSLDAALIVAPGPATAALREWVHARGGLPAPNPWPRDFQGALDVCRAGFLNTVWDEKSEKWRHCIDWAPGHAPGFAALLWADSQIAAKAEARQQARTRVDLAARNMLRDGGPGLFASQTACHIMQWEFPFLYGHLPEALNSIDGLIHELIQSQQPDGSWRYRPGDAQQADLGQTGDSVLGTCANRASTLLRYARITGDTAALAAGERALRFMENFRVPRGGQTWECPMYEPDILAAAYAIRAYHDAYRATANARWLHDAVYWAETGVPFVYLWTLPDKPMMLGATIPVFGSTFYRHTWLAVPVQWCGLVYSYHLWHLAQELERGVSLSTDSPLPLALDFSPADWKRLVELITVSALYQQFSDGQRVGAYPDSISGFERRNPAFLNPEDILVNLLALQGHDPDVKTARIRRPNSDLVISSGAKIIAAAATPSGTQFQLQSVAGDPSHVLLAGLKPERVLVDGQRLPRSTDPVRREPGWWWDDKHQRAYLTVLQERETVQVEILTQSAP
jgi:hypothetical protein